MRNSKTLNICFHGIGDKFLEREPGEGQYWITEPTFQRVLDEIMTWPKVRISFDDGNLSDLDIGLPALVQRNLTASFFVIAGRIGDQQSLSAADILTLRSAGMTIGSHGMDHRSWRGLSTSEQRRELVDARAMIADAAGTPVTEAAVPLGLYDRALLSQLRALQYTAVHTSDRRPAEGRSWIQPRYSVTAADDPDTLRQNILRPLGYVERTTLTVKGVVKRLR